ncbi:MAG TPA: TIM barrel protein [Vicinamibacterales bacterium]|nr:TIM barrel protein [Vicinamibacterales bacterium]
MSEIDRRSFVAALAALSCSFRLKAEDRRIQAEGRRKMRLGYAAITWGGNDEQAIDDISEVGFRGIQLRASAFDKWGASPGDLRALLQRRRVEFAGLSSGNLQIDPASEGQQVDLHLSHAAFVRDAGGQFIQVIDEKPKDHAVGPDDYKRLGQLMSELGRRTAAIGVPLVYHHHMNSIGQPPQAIDAILDASDPASVGLLFDIAHYEQGGGDPVAGIRRHAKRIKVVHLKDVRAIDASPGYQWVELGRGRVDVKGCVTALREAGFDGWTIVELDRVVDAAGSPKTSAVANRDYVITRLGLTL